MSAPPEWLVEAISLGRGPGLLPSERMQAHRAWAALLARLDNEATYQRAYGAIASRTDTKTVANQYLTAVTLAALAAVREALGEATP